MDHHFNVEEWQVRLASSFRAIAALLTTLEPDDARFMLRLIRTRADLCLTEDTEHIREVAAETFRRLKLRREANETMEGIE